MASNRTILGIDPAACTGLAIRVTDESGYRTISARIAEVEVHTAEQAEAAFMNFLGMDRPDRIVIEGMYVGKSRGGSVTLADLAGWFEMLAAHYFPGVPRFRPTANMWRPCCGIQCDKDSNPKGQAIRLARANGLVLPERVITRGPRKGQIEVSHNAAEAFCMTYFPKER